MQRRTESEETVLVGVLKNQRDYDLLFRKHWYRMPMLAAPTRKFRYLAFYQPAAFGREGKRIQYYARVLQSLVRTRRVLLPHEPKHPRASEPYVQIRVGKIRALKRPIRNVLPRRVFFGFTTLRRLLAVKSILQLYGVAPTEQMIGRVLKRQGIPAIAQQTVSDGSQRYRLDFAIFCTRGRVAIECDNVKAHAGRRQRERDTAKDAFLRQRGWTVIRLAEQDILARPEHCLLRVQRALKRLGGSGRPPRVSSRKQ